MPTATPNYGTVMVIDPHIDGGQNPIFIGSVVATYYQPLEKRTSRPAGLMTSAELPPSQINAQKAYPMRRILPWINPRSRSLLRSVSPGFGPTWKTMEWIPFYASTIRT